MVACSDFWFVFRPLLLNICKSFANKVFNMMLSVPAIASALLLAGFVSAQTPAGFEPEVKDKLEIVFGSNAVDLAGESLTKAGAKIAPSRRCLCNDDRQLGTDNDLHDQRPPANRLSAPKMRL